MRLVVVGAGYAGTVAANRLVKKVKAAEITVINPVRTSSSGCGCTSRSPGPEPRRSH